LPVDIPTDYLPVDITTINPFCSLWRYYKGKDRSREAECMQSKACSDATIQSVATSTQKEEDGIGLQGETKKKRKREREYRGVNQTTFSEKALVTESYVRD
jgi:hypothetical protein